MENLLEKINQKIELKMLKKAKDEIYLSDLETIGIKLFKEIFIICKKINSVRENYNFVSPYFETEFKVKEIPYKIITAIRIKFLNSCTEGVLDIEINGNFDVPKTKFKLFRKKPEPEFTLSLPKYCFDILEFTYSLEAESSYSSYIFKYHDEYEIECEEHYPGFTFSFLTEIQKAVLKYLSENINNLM